MPVFHYQSGNLPEPAEFRRLLREASEEYDPVDELLILERALRDLEQRYRMPSDEFYARFVDGKAGDDPDLVGWAARYEAFLRLKAAISEGLKRACVPLGQRRPPPRSGDISASQACTNWCKSCCRCDSATYSIRRVA